MKIMLSLLLLFYGLLDAGEIQYKIDHLLQPVVRVVGKKGAGSGVVIASRKVKDGYRNFVITNWHVVQDAIGENEKKEETRDVVTVKTYEYAEKGRKTIECTQQARIIEHSKEFDLALLEILDRTVELSHIPLLPTKETLELFQPIWHVGFPGGIHLIFVQGIINSLEKDSYSTKVGFMPKYFTTNGPIWYGSSGGLTAREIDGTFYLAGISTLKLDTDCKQGAPYINWSISIRSIRLFFGLNSLEFLFDNTMEIPTFRTYLRPKRNFDIKIDLFDVWRKQE